MLNRAIIGFLQSDSSCLASSMVRQYAQQVRCSLATKTAAYLLSILPDHTASSVTAAKLLDNDDNDDNTITNTNTNTNTNTKMI